MKNKVLLFLIPFSLILMAAVFFLEEGDKAVEDEKQAGMFVSYDADQKKPNEDKLGSRRERMAAEYQDEAKKRRHTKPDDFFSSAKMTQSENSKDSVVEEEVQKETSKPVYRPQSYSAPKSAPRQEEQQQPTGSTSRKRVGFSGGATGSTTGGTASKDNHDTKILVVVHRAVTVKTGQIVKLRVVEDVVVAGLKLPAGTFIDGIARFGTNRLHIDVEGLNVNGQLIRKKFAAFSLTGLEGLEVSGSIGSEGAQDAAGGSVDYVERRVNLPVIGGVVSRKSNEALKEQSIPVDAGTKLYLM